MPRFAVRHATTYAFSGLVRLGRHQLYLRPRGDHALRVDSAVLTLSPPGEVIWRNDPYGNSVALVEFAQQVDRLEIVSELFVETFPRSEGQRRVLLAQAAGYTEVERRALHPFMGLNDTDAAAIKPWLSKTAQKNKPAYDKVLECAARIRAEFDYRLRYEPGVQTASQTLSSYSGTCRDFAEFMIAAARSLGFAARFVTGYVHVPNAAPGSCSPHAWAECYLPGTGWIEIDATNGLVEHGDLIPIAVAATGIELPPVSGEFNGSATSSLFVSVDVTPTALAT